MILKALSRPTLTHHIRHELGALHGRNPDGGHWVNGWPGGAQHEAEHHSHHDEHHIVDVRRQRSDEGEQTGPQLLLWRCGLELPNGSWNNSLGA